MVDKIVEVAHQRLNFYTGNYTSYITQKAERSAIHANSYENQQRQIAEAERFIERFRAKASKASQAQSRIKMLEKMDRIDAPDTDEPTVSFRFRKTERCGNEVLALKNATKRFDAKVILKGTNATITRGDKIGLIGANGTGKSTVLRMIAGTEPFEGERIVGHKVVPAFFAQHQLEALHLNFTILEEFHEEILEYTETYVRGVLGGFLFTGDDVKKRISVLSGGEKSRVALAKTLLSHANFLLLDEPTNHLDMQSIQIMTEALREYDGTYIIVSHDRYFLEQITNKIWYIEDQEVKEYPGSYTEYAWWREKQAQDAANTKAPKVEKKEEPATKTQSKKTNQAPQATKVADPKARKQLENKIKNIESSIEKLENQKQNLEAQMAEAATDFNKLADIQRKHAETDRELQTVLENWEALCYELEQI
jgi:ATP-binding cassette subfamily F protein 3